MTSCRRSIAPSTFCNWPGSAARSCRGIFVRVSKPIFGYYLGDHDPSGCDLERDLKDKVRRYSRREITWERLGVIATDFAEHNLVRLPIKPKDKRAPAFIAAHGPACAEVDALPATELRRRVREAIGRHIDQDRWEDLLRIEQLEREAITALIHS